MVESNRLFESIDRRVSRTEALSHTRLLFVYDMRFSLTFVVALAAVATAAPSHLDDRSLLTDITGLVGKLEDGLGVTQLEDGLDKLLGGALSKVSTQMSCCVPHHALTTNLHSSRPSLALPLLKSFSAFRMRVPLLVTFKQSAREVSRLGMR